MSKNLSLYDHSGYIRKRTAIIITGQLRSGNISFSSGLLANHTINNFGPDDPPTPILTQLVYIMKPLSEMGGIDVFMYVEASTEDSSYVWDGRPETFRAKANDTTACRPYSEHELFKRTGNRLLCFVGNEQRLMNLFLDKYSMWQRYLYNSKDGIKNEQALRQYYSMYRANQACKQFAVAHNVTYTYKLRLRPDTAVCRFPDLSKVDFHKKVDPNCDSIILFPNIRVSGRSHRWIGDWDNFGLAADMDHMLDHYEDMILSDFYAINRPDKNFPIGAFNLEFHLEHVLYTKYRICMRDNIEFWMFFIRLENHDSIIQRAGLPPRLAPDWTEMSI
jgi:hypothetical protein